MKQRRTACVVLFAPLALVVLGGQACHSAPSGLVADDLTGHEKRAIVAAADAPAAITEGADEWSIEMETIRVSLR